jgi:hypothetical protein
MFPDPNMDAALFEIEERHRQADLHRLAGACRRADVSEAGRLRWALGSFLLRLGAIVSGEDAWLRTDAR